MSPTASRQRRRRTSSPSTDEESTAIRGDFPILHAHRPRRAAAGLPRLRATSQKPHGRARRRARASTSSTTRNVHRGGAPARRGGHRRLRGAPATTSPRFVGAPTATRSCSPRTPPRRSTWSPTPSPTRRRPGSDGPAPTLPLGPGDEIVVTEMEHHSNLVPWQQLCQRTGATLRWFRLTDDGRLDLVRPRRAGQRAHEGGRLHPRVQHARHDQPGAPSSSTAPTRSARSSLLDGAQSVPHLPVDVAALGADFLAFTGHKMLGPTGIGVLWGAHELLDALPPFLGGGSMIETVPMEGTTFAPAPQRFEAGMPPIAAGDRARRGGRLPRRRSAWTAIAAHEQRSPRTLLEGLAERPRRPRHRPARRRRARRSRRLHRRAAVIHPHDVGQVLDDAGHRRPRRPPLRAGRLPAATGCRRRPARSFAATTPATRSTRSSTARPGASASSGCWSASG